MNLHVELAVELTQLVLIGGGEFSFGETREIDEFLLSRLLPSKRGVAFLPTASGSAEYAGHFGTYLQTIDPSIVTTNVPVYRVRDGRRGKNAAAVEAAGLIYLGGGVTNSLLATLPASPVEEAMRRAAAAGSVIAAIGAAASSFGSYAADMRGTTPALPALGWLPGTVIDTAFDPSRSEELRRLMSLPDVRLGIGIPTRTALAIGRGGETEIVGEGQVTVFRKT